LFSGHSIVIQWSFSGHSIVIQLSFSSHSVVIWWLFGGKGKRVSFFLLFLFLRFLQICLLNFVLCVGTGLRRIKAGGMGAAAHGGESQCGAGWQERQGSYLQAVA